MNPKTFISYSWSSPEHEAWVLKLATELREAGVDVFLDKWDLREGHDAYAFMEKMVTDPEVTKVILVCDQKYAEKTDSRSGGVGTEAQIISPAIYARTDQNKFVAILSEVGPDNQPYVPTYYRGRIHIDLSSDDIYQANFEQLVRWTYDKPVHSKPALGKAPSFITETSGPSLSNAALQRRALDAIKNAKPFAKGAIDEYFASCVIGLEAFRIAAAGQDDFDEAVVKSIEGFLPYRAQVVEIFIALAQYRDTEEARQQIHRFFERLLPFFEVPENSNSYHTCDFDNFKFIAHELFLYLNAALLKYEAFEFAGDLMRQRYYVAGGRRNSGTVVSFTEFRQHLRSLTHRNARLKANRASVHADLLERRSHASGVEFQHIMQADFVLFLRSSLDALRGGTEQWWPESLIYHQRHLGAFEIFARSESKRYFARVLSMLDIQSKAELSTLLEAFQTRKLHVPTWQVWGIDPARMMAFDKIASAL
ncbi:MAG: hypothetical protein ABS54_01615 [Hyphomicrobium sp. SCN 65-11]|nr:MAG: hypothetical protein ABS54_01615 [Hyphomicrobium sp. SCN 65-11]